MTLRCAAAMRLQHKSIDYMQEHVLVPYTRVNAGGRSIMEYMQYNARKGVGVSGST